MNGPFNNATVKIIKSFLSIVYLDETWVNQNHATEYMWLPVDGSDAPKIPSGKGNASYHNIKTEETVVPNFNQRNAVLQNYLSKHNILFQPLETKKQLYEKNLI
jgi:hypothetical protein